MSPAEPKRARDDGARAARREAILDALAALYEKAPYERITVAAVAARSRLAKGTVYLYFPTREAMFLALYLRHGGVFADALTALAENFRDPEDLAKRIADALAANPKLLRLMALAPTVLEWNIDRDVAREVKISLMARLAGPAKALERRLPGFARGDGIRFLLRLNALAVGLSEMANPSPVVAEVLAADPKLRLLRIDFRKELAAALAALLRGWR